MMNTKNLEKKASSSLEKALYEVGFDICHPFPISIYNECIHEKNLPLQALRSPSSTDSKLSDGDEEEHSSSLSSSTKTKTIAYLIGNTKHFWPIFIRWLKDQQQQQQNIQLQQLQNPVDTYTHTKVTEVLKNHVSSSSSEEEEEGSARSTSYYYDVYWSDEYNCDRLVSMQQVASCSGFAYLDEISHLVVHPIYGTWISFRAVVVFDIHDENTTNNNDQNTLITTKEPSILPCLLTAEEKISAKLAIGKALEISSKDNNNLCDQLHGRTTSQETATAWIELRDCIVSRGKDYRFDETQLWYHYTKDIKYLEEALRKEDC